MKFKSLLLATLLVMASCSDNDEMPIDNSQQTVTENTSKISWNYPVLSPVFNELEQNYIFEYDSQGRVSKKVGGKLELSGSTGFSYAYSKSVYTMITYTGNTAIMKNYSSDPSFNVQLKERRFEFDNQGRVIKLVIPEVNNSYMDKYLTYTYDASGKLIEILTQYPNVPYDPTDPQDYILTYVEKFIYNNSGNLEKATKTQKHNNVDAYITNEITFDNFDSAQNPFKNLGIFEDYFYFSLSKNNPQRRISKEYQPYSSEFFLNQSNWTNQYNTNGRLKLFY
ncbi:RHS Repeat [Chryseobacterium nakagawai]|uniref:YD repeat-containing protein n=1 Tax=Chryseobacterium nakagawai TaxID=1241982 RepID=A0AAD0YKE8_CHRNA|nr:hypothetical protein [Chryseobacterium nakagawai]AZA91432.1 hypothetical protein EG343_12705 [Chryseobacterium nakagawai]VEH23022.1 RHS Repeat [Chryseobacterium nakagawai]